jgi:hypothetical protein
MPRCLYLVGGALLGSLNVGLRECLLEVTRYWRRTFSCKLLPKSSRIVSLLRDHFELFLNVVYPRAQRP